MERKVLWRITQILRTLIINIKLSKSNRVISESNINSWIG